MSVLDTISAEFNPSTAKEWEDLFLKETKQNNLAIRKHYLGFDYLPFYTSSTSASSQNVHLAELFPSPQQGLWINASIETTPAENANKRVLNLLSQGISSVTFKGKIESYHDFSALLKQVEAAYIEVNFKQHYNSVQLVKWYHQWSLANQVNMDKLNGVIHCDPIGSALYNGGWHSNKEADLKSCLDTFTTTQEHFNQLKCIVVNAGVYHYAGANITQTMAYTLAHAVEYITYFKNAGIDPLLVIPRIVFEWPVGLHFFGELASLRAFHLVWNTICQYITKSNQVFKATINAETSVFMWSAKDAHTNMIRATTQAMAAMCGGVNHVHVYPFNTFKERNDEFSNRIAKNVQLLLKEESFLGKVVDPAGGSFYVEELTNQIAHNTTEMFKSLEAKGGLIASMEAGHLQQEIQNNADQLKKDFNESKIKVLGANLYPNNKEEHVNFDLSLVFNESSRKGQFTPLLPFVLAHHAV